MNDDNVKGILYAFLVVFGLYGLIEYHNHVNLLESVLWLMHSTIFLTTIKLWSNHDENK